MLERFVNSIDFSSYEDFRENFRIIIPERFNFAYDVVDEWAKTHPNKTALVWVGDNGGYASFTFGELKRQSDKTANYLKSLGIGKGDSVMLILQRKYEFWFCLLALMKLGAVAIPATHLLTKKDIAYRNNAADIKMIIAVNDERVLKAVEEAESESKSLRSKTILNGKRNGWNSLEEGASQASEDFPRPTGADATVNEDMMLIYFTSGTTGMPKMVMHDFSYPLGHILTAKFWQNVTEDGLHLTVADTGWAKAAWGKIYGQWICGTAIFVYDYERFDPKRMLDVITRYKVTTFCAPPTIYRAFVKEDLTQYDWSNMRYCCSAGEPLNPEVFNAFKQATGLEIMEGFGQTETVVAVATYPWIEPRPGSMGKPSPGYDVDLINEKGEPCEAGEEGQLIIRTNPRKAPGMFRGYYRDAELTESVWSDGVYRTGDMAWRDEDGYY